MPARFAVAAVVAFSSLTLACGRGGDTAQRFVERGDQYAAEGRHDAAVIEYRNALKKEPTLAAAYTKLGDAYVEQGKPEEAYRAYCNATDLDASDGHARVEAGRLLFSAGRFEEALVRAVQTLERDEQNVDAQILSGRALTKLRRYDEAVTQLDAAVAVDHRPSAYAALGDAKQAAGDAAGAEAAFRAGVERAPQSVEARVALAHYLAATSRPAEAEQQLLQAVAANPTSELANRAAANFYVSNRRDEAAESFFKTAAAQPNQKMKSTLALADYYSTARRYDDARAVLERVTSGPMVAAAKVRRTAIELEVGSTANARRIIDGVLKNRPTADALAVNAQLLLREGKPDEALAAARAAIDLDPAVDAAQYVVGIIELDRRHYENAERAFREVLRQNRLTGPATLQLARARLGSGHAADAVELAEKAHAEPGARLTLARALIADGQIGRARNELAQLDAANPPSPEPAILLGSIDLAAGHVPAARDHAARALSIAPKSSEALVLAARAAIATGDRPAAEQYLTRAIASDPASFESHTMLADLYASRRDFDRARTTLEQFAQRQPDAAAPQTALGIVLEAAGRPADARARYEQALTIDPKDPIASNNLARLYAPDDAKVERAIELARTAVAKLPEDADVHDTLGWVAYRAGRLSLAASELERATILDPNDVTYRRHLTEVRQAIAEEARLAAEARARAVAEAKAAQQPQHQD
jgi:tetratricopeptide (TPR) repeat protein